MRNNRDIALPPQYQAAAEPANGQDPYRNLAVAIFEQAVKDYQSQSENPDAQDNREAAKEWLESPDFEEFCGEFLDYDEGWITEIRCALDIEPSP